MDGNTPMTYLHLLTSAQRVHNDWNAHNQYIPEYVIHKALVNSDVATTSPDEAELFFIP